MQEALTYICPFCDREAKVGKPCPGCVEKTSKPKKSVSKRKPDHKKRSWEQSESADGLGLPDDDFDYNEFVSREFSKTPHHQLGVKWYWWMLGVIVLLALAAGSVYR